MARAEFLQTRNCQWFIFALLGSTFRTKSSQRAWERYRLLRTVISIIDLAITTRRRKREMRGQH